jgi:hypothetical protein
MIFLADKDFLLDYAKDLLHPKIIYSAEFLQAADHWAKENNCVHSKHFTMECSEEDYIMIKLKHPDVFYDNN